MEPVLEEPAGMINNHAPQKNKIIKQQRHNNKTALIKTKRETQNRIK